MSSGTGQGEPPWLTAYWSFWRSVVDHDLARMAEHFHIPTFRAELPGVPGPLTYSEFRREVERRAGPFSDFGKWVEILAWAVNGDALFVYYRMALTNDGPLSDAAGHVIQASGQSVTMTAVDIVCFNSEGLITSLVVVSDRLNTLNQMYRPRS